MDLLLCQILIIWTETFHVYAVTQAQAGFPLVFLFFIFFLINVLTLCLAISENEMKENKLLF